MQTINNKMQYQSKKKYSEHQEINCFILNGKVNSGCKINLFLENRIKTKTQKAGCTKNIHTLH